MKTIPGPWERKLGHVTPPLRSRTIHAAAQAALQRRWWLWPSARPTRASGSTRTTSLWVPGQAPCGLMAADAHSVVNSASGGTVSPSPLGLGTWSWTVWSPRGCGRGGSHGHVTRPNGHDQFNRWASRSVLRATTLACSGSPSERKQEHVQSPALTAPGSLCPLDAGRGGETHCPWRHHIAIGAQQI